jgi:hypothetical protein
MTPTVFELYTEERIGEFERSAELPADEVAATRRVWTGKPRRRR